MTPRFLFPFLGLVLISAVASGQQSKTTRFDQWDRNADGKLTREELPQPIRANFDRVDRNKDGFISREEDAAMGAGRNQPRNSAPRSLEGVRVMRDLDYAGNDNPRQKLDLYLPEKRATDSSNLPVIVFIHGGGWQNGDKTSGGQKIAALVASGKYAGASIGYRLTNEAQWPSQIHDCKAGLRWIRAHAAEYGLDPNRIAVWGTSAGGHLVAMLGVSHGVEGLEGAIGPHLDQSSEVQAVVDFFGPTEMLTMGDHPSKIDHNAINSPESKLIGGAVQENPEKAKSASPIEHVSADDEPFLIVHGTADDLVPYPQSVDFEKKLEAAGVSVTLLTVEGGGHGKGFGPSVDAAVEAFLAKQLLGEERELKDSTVNAGE